MTATPDNMTPTAILDWLRETDPARLEELWRRADETRRRVVGDAVHLRGLVEISNHCARQCAYCGIRAGNQAVVRYRMTAEEIQACAEDAVRLGYGTLVLQSGEDYGVTREWLAAVVQQVKAATPLAVTLSLGERPAEDLAAWRAAGADRYLLRFETSDQALYQQIHPDLPGRRSDRFALLQKLKALGYETGSGVMTGIPGQSYQSLVQDLVAFRELDLDMIGVGPYVPHPATPLGRGEGPAPLPPDEQVPGGEELVYKTLALARLLCPQANIPSTTALATINRQSGRELGLRRGANVVMPNLTPAHYREMYQIYPDKACLNETARESGVCLRDQLAAWGRQPGMGQGSRRHDT